MPINSTNKLKKRLSVIFICVLLVLCAAICTAHSGGTDSNGGHYDSSTKEYHYHHGYPAHYHTDGVCPYKISSNSSNNTSYSEEIQKPTKNNKNIVGVIVIIILMVLVLFLTPIGWNILNLICMWIGNMKEKLTTNKAIKKTKRLLRNNDAIEYNNFMQYMNFAPSAQPKKKTNKRWLCVVTCLSFLLVATVGIIVVQQRQIVVYQSEIATLSKDNTLYQNKNEALNTQHANTLKQIASLKEQYAEAEEIISLYETSLSKIYSLAEPIAATYAPEKYTKGSRLSIAAILQDINDSITNNEMVFVKNSISHTVNTQPQKTFWLGASEQQVRDVMGPPDKIECVNSYSIIQYNHSEWYYGTSYVKFDGYGKVIGWEEGNRKLYVN